MMSPRSDIFVRDAKDGRPWVGPLGAVGSEVNIVESPGELDGEAAFLLTRATQVLPAALTRMQDGAAAVLQRKPDLNQMVSVLHHPGVRAAVVEDYLDARLLTYISSKAIWGDIFGISKVVPWGVKVHSELVNSHEDRNRALAMVARFAKSFRLRKKYREAIETVLDELLMNALYNAPVDSQGEQVFGEVAPRDRSGMRLERPAILQVACDGAHFALSVRDSFGSLRRDTLLQYLERASQTGGEIETKTSGAGLGLYLVASNTTEFIVNLLPGTATEMIAVFDLSSPKQQLKHLGIYEETFSRLADQPAGAGPGSLVVDGGAGRAPAANSKLTLVTLLTAVLLLITAGVLLVFPYFKGPDHGSLEVEVAPAGATVYLNGVRKGEASPRLLLDGLDTSTTFSVSARLAGYAESREVVNVERNKRSRLKFVLSSRGARVKINSTPPGAKIVVDGEATNLETPAVLEGLKPGMAHRISLERFGFKATADDVTPKAQETLNLQIKLPLADGFATVSLTSTPTGARLWVNDVDTGLKTPVAEHVIRSGQEFTLKLTADGHVPWTEEVKLNSAAHQNKTAKLFKGGAISVRSNLRAQVAVAGFPARRLPLVKQLVPAGSYRVKIVNQKLDVDHAFVVNVKGGEVITRQLIFGLVSGKNGTTFKAKDGTTVRRIARLPGQHTVTVVNKEGKPRQITVKVVARKTAAVD